MAATNSIDEHGNCKVCVAKLSRIFTKANIGYWIRKHLFRGFPWPCPENGGHILDRK